MVLNFKQRIHFFNIKGFINLNIDYKVELLARIHFSFSSLLACSKNLNCTSVTLSYFLEREDTFMSIHYFCELLDLLDVNYLSAEKHIISFKDYARGKPMFIKFPVDFSPLYMRVISCLVGDGSIHKTNLMMRWIQKDPSPMVNLIHSLVGFKPVIHTRGMQVTIPAFFGKIGSFVLNLNLFDLASYKIVKRVKRLPRSFQVVFLLGVIEDEANIDWKYHGGIDFRLADKRLLSELWELSKGLDYDVSPIAKIKNIGGFKKGWLYRFKIRARGISSLSKDINRLESKYGNMVGLWKKKCAFDMRLKSIKT